MYSKQSSILIVMIIIISASSIEFDAIAHESDLEITPLNQTITVDDSGGANYTRINDALTHANPGDTILVKPGRYKEILRIAKSITLKGSGSHNTKIEGLNWGNVIQIYTDWVNVSGFNIFGSGTQYFNAGIYIGDYKNCNISNNNCSDNNIGIFILGSNNIISDNVCNSNSEDGILIYGASSNRPTQNWLSNNKCHYNNKNGINFTSSSNTGENNYFINNSCYSNRNHGIYSNMPFNTITNNYCVQNNYSGISITSNSNTIENNSLFKNLMGIKLESNERNDIVNNTCFSNNLQGLVLKNSILNNINSNNFSSNENGISLNFESDNNNIYQNTISANTYFGIKIDEEPRMNKIFHNNFILNNVQGGDISINENYWYHPSYEEGNYWSDYKGLDNGEGSRIKGDGIGDSAVPHLGLDIYPFISQDGWNYPGSPILTAPGELDIDGNYELTWSLGYRATGYILEEDINGSFNTSTVIYQGSNLSFSISNKATGRYFYRVRSVKDQFKSPWSNIVNITVSQLPEVPRNFTASINPKGNEIILNWSPNQRNTKEYQIEFKTNDTEVWEYIKSIPHPSSIYVHTKLTDGLMYFYRIRAKNEFDLFSQYSDEITATPRDLVAPKKPTGLKITNITNKSITIEWEDNLEDDLTGYNLYRNLNQDIIDWGFPINGDKLINQSLYMDNNLDESRTYFYRITALDDVPNESEFSDIISGTTLMSLNKPVIHHPQKDFQIPEDTIDSTTIKLYEWFSDPDGDILNFNCSGQVHLEIIIIQETGFVVIKPEINWNGQEMLTFSASDGIFKISDAVVITVIPFNDAPVNVEILEPENGLNTNDSTIIHFVGKCDDPDVDYGDDLEFIWVLNDIQIISRENDFYKILPAGVYKVTLTVYDLLDESVSTSVTITVEKTAGSEPPEAPPGTPGEENKTASRIENNTGLYIFVGFLITSIILIFLLLIFLLQKRKRPIKPKQAAKTTRRQEKKESLPVDKRKKKFGKKKNMRIGKN